MKVGLVQANQSFATPANPSGCTAASGIAPSLVAAIEGAAQCLSQGGQGAFQCQVAYIANASACSMMHCFPGDLQAHLLRIIWTLVAIFHFILFLFESCCLFPKPNPPCSRSRYNALQLRVAFFTFPTSFH